MNRGKPVPGWIGAKDLLADAVEHGSRAIEDSQRSVTRRVFSALGAVTRRPADVARLEPAVWFVLSSGYRHVRLVSRLASLAVDVTHDLTRPALQVPGATEAPIPLRSDVAGGQAWLWDSFIGAVNGVVGDHLEASNNPLAIPMTLRLQDRYLELGRAGEPGIPASLQVPGEGPLRLCVFVHGLAATEWSWAWDAAQRHGDPSVNYGTLLAADQGWTPVYVRYNSGRHISENGEQLAQMLTSLLDALARPVDEIALVGHSMGGLVAHSAAYHGQQGQHGWVQRLCQVVSIASPHDGAPLEKLGSLVASALEAFDLPGTRIPADVINARSAGIRDLRHGCIVERDWQLCRGDGPLRDDRSPTPWLEGVSYHRLVSTLTTDPANPIGTLLGDIMVRPESAAATSPVHGGPDHPGEVAHVSGITHVALANHPAVYAHLRRWLAEAPGGR